MRKIHLIILLFLKSVCYSQDFKIPEIEFQEIGDKQNPYVKLLNLKDENSLIIKIGFESYWAGGIHSNLIVFQNDGNVVRYNVFFPKDNLKKIEISKKRIKKEKIPDFWILINSVAKENKLNIDKDKLNIERIEYEDGTVLKYSTRSDCVDESFEITQGNKKTYFSSYDPLYQIKQKNSGFEERQKLVDLIDEVENLIKIKSN
ncbi:hypothetical protein ACFFLS_19995 [Flavobacterium procerum]|uniref:Uncharacterized protein n=1 Tax=Flavobacterium procerum TaxID=1455569 RepID=A0ABV6BV70_9FLAO